MVFVHVHFLCTQLIFQPTYQRGFMKCLTASDVLRVVTVLVCDGVPVVGKMQTNCLKMNKITALLERYGYWEVTIRTPFKMSGTYFRVSCDMQM